MSATLGRPFVPVDITTEFVALERRVNTAEMRERGIGRAPWRKVISTRGYAVYDGAVPGWRRLNDGRVEVRGRLAISSLAGGTTVMHIPGECSPPGSSSVSAIAPCSSAGTNPGNVRVDFTVATGDDGTKVTAVIAYPPNSVPLTGWIGFDHVIYDQNLYIDVLPPVDYGEDPVDGMRNLVVITRHGESFSVIPGTTPVLIPQPTPRPRR